MRIDECITNPDFIRNPFPFYREIRETEPIHWSEKWRCWIVTDYENCATCLKNARQFSNCGRVTGLFNSIFDEGERERLRPLMEHYSEGLINIDPPDHTRLRKILQKVFMPSVIKEMAENISFTVEELLDRATQGGKREIDLINEFSHPLPVSVISSMFGVPNNQTHLFTKWSAGIVRFMQSPKPTFEECLYSQENLIEMRSFLKREIQLRQRTPYDDLLGLLVNSEEDGEKLTDEEILSTSVTILLGGHETTTRLIANTIYDLLKNEDQLAKLINQPEIMEKSVEEFVRFSGPFHRDQRVAARDLELGGHQVKKGDYILMMLQSANRDPSIFEAPEEMRIDRNARRHIGFGSGPHVCLGGHLARMEVAIALRALLRRCTNLRLIEEPNWTYGFLRGPDELKLAFD